MAFEPEVLVISGTPDTIEEAAGKVNRNFDAAALQLGSSSNEGVETHEQTYDHTLLPSADEKAALAGSSGTPSSSNKYVTYDDTCRTNARTPVAHGSSLHSGTIGTESQVTFNPLTGHKHDGSGSRKVAHGDLNNPGTNTHAQIDSHIGAASPHSGHATLVDGKLPAAVLGSGTADSSTFLAGDQTFKQLTISSAVNIENTLAMIAWDVYSQDIAFDDIYVDDFTDQTGVDTVNSTGTYNSGGSYYTSEPLTGQTVDVTTSQQDCTTWADVSSVAITQTTPGDKTASAIYHAVSFDGGTTYKVYKSSAWTTVAYNNSGTWQYNNAGSLTNASTNSLAGAMTQSTAQAAYQWTKANIEAMADADWNATGGWSTSTNTIDWTYRAVDGETWTADGASNSGIDYGTPDMTADNQPSPAVVSADFSANASWPLYMMFDRDLGTFLDSQSTDFSSGSVTLDLGSGNATNFNKYALYPRASFAGNMPQGWTLYGSNDNSNWTQLDSRTGQTFTSGNWSSYYTYSSSTAYRYWKFLFQRSPAGILDIAEIKMVIAAYTTATPTFTKVTFSYDTEVVDMDLRTNGWEASADDPTSAYCVLDVEPVDSITLDTDLKAWISTDNGGHYTQFDLASAPFREIGDHDYLRGDVVGLTGYADKTIRLKVTSHNDKRVKLHGIAVGVKY